MASDNLNSSHFGYTQIRNKSRCKEKMYQRAYTMDGGAGSLLNIF
jgi:hypothetical protein